MILELSDIGKKFNYNWIFKGVSFQFHSGEPTAILGANGSGKSTLLRIMAGQLSPDAGTIQVLQPFIKTESLAHNLNYCAPYLDLPEEFTLEEILLFHNKFRKLREGYSIQTIISDMGLGKSRHKSLKLFSSGMKQRTKLALAFFFDAPICLFDEPTSHLDDEGVEWYLSHVEKLAKTSITVVCSNQMHEYQFCSKKLVITQFSG